MANSFKFKHFEVRNEASALKVGTDAVLLGATMTIRTDDRNLLDIGTGTGVIALMAAQRLEAAKAGKGSEGGNPEGSPAPAPAPAPYRITGVEIDHASAQEASLNFITSPWRSHLHALETPLSAFRPDAPFDLVFSNPPYFDESLRNPDPRESEARHTQSLSYRDICAFCAEHLSPEGRLALILPAETEKTLVRTAASFGLYLGRIVRIRTVERKLFKRIIAEFSRVRTTPQESSLTLQKEGKRTQEYASLTEDFYL